MTALEGPWAKLERDGARAVVAALPLPDHCLDVGAAMEVVIPGWRRALETAAGRPLTDGDIARLIVLAALHDLGKANRGFQARIDPRRPVIGHTGPVAALLYHSTLRHGAAADLLHALIDDWQAHQHFAAVMAHHGRPLPEFRRMVRPGPSPFARHADHWQADAARDPCADVIALVAAIRARWPSAWAPGPPLPAAPRFVALFAGLVTLADWTGSDARRFPVAGPHGAARDPLRREAAQAAATARGFAPLATPAGTFADAFVHSPHGFQAQVAATDLGTVALIEAETGAGKTEAALWRWLELRRHEAVDGLFFALPTRSAAVQLHQRVNRMLKRVWGEGAPEAVLAVPGYLRAGDADGQALPGFAVRWDDGEPGGAGDARWAAEHADRFLAARVAVGTIDQALLGVLPVRHALFRAGVLARSLLVVDEVHASDAYMGALLERLLDQHVGAGGHALLLSATLGADARARLLKTPALGLPDAEVQPYPALSGRAAPPRPTSGGDDAGKRVRIEVAGLIVDAAAIAARAVAAARTGASVLVVRNSVDGAVAVAQAVEAQARDLAFSVADRATVHHGRFAPDDRRLLDAAVETAFGRERVAAGRVLVGTQTLEQSLDIDADFLVTDLAPMDVLLQRIGRLHRHRRQDRGGHGTAAVLVLRPAERDLAPLLGPAGPRHGLGGRAYPDLLQLEATLRLIEAEAEIVLPRDNRRLVERALHRDARSAIARELGPAWVNHGNMRSGSIHAARGTAEVIALDLSMPFRDLHFRDEGERAATRLGARDLLVDLDVALEGPFGMPVSRIAVPAWMAGGVDAADGARRLDGARFQLGPRCYVYDRWGLRQER